VAGIDTTDGSGNRVDTPYGKRITGKPSPIEVIRRCDGYAVPGLALGDGDGLAVRHVCDFFTHRPMKG
jgi:hypothetical protein